MCPPPNISYNGSLLTQSRNSALVTSFEGVREVEFEVRIGPAAGDKQRCKLSCLRGQWIGPLCKSAESADSTSEAEDSSGEAVAAVKEGYVAMKRSCPMNLHPPRQIVTYQFKEVKVCKIAARGYDIW